MREETKLAIQELSKYGKVDIINNHRGEWQVVLVTGDTNLTYKVHNATRFIIYSGFYKTLTEAIISVKAKADKL